MNRPRKALLVVGAVGLVVLAVPTVLAASGPVPFRARDLDCDGWVSLKEWYAAGSDEGWRPAVGGPAGCMEAFRYKDGLPDVIVCPDVPRCRRQAQ